MSTPSRLKQPLLYSLIASILIGAVLGIVLILRNTWGWFEVRVMLTTLVIALASVACLACELSRRPSGRNLSSILGLVLSAISGIMWLFCVWLEPNDDWVWKSVVTISILALANVHVCLLSNARLAQRFRWVFAVTVQIIFGLAFLILAMIWFEIDSPVVWRIVAMLSILVAAMTLIIPILHRIGRHDGARGEQLTPSEEQNIAKIDAEIERLESQLTKLRSLRLKFSGSDDSAV
jgi:hypothetical protein